MTGACETQCGSAPKKIRILQRGVLCIDVEFSLAGEKVILLNFQKFGV